MILTLVLTSIFIDVSNCKFAKTLMNLMLTMLKLHVNL